MTILNNTKTIENLKSEAKKFMTGIDMPKDVFNRGYSLEMRMHIVSNCHLAIDEIGNNEIFTESEYDEIGVKKIDHNDDVDDLIILKHVQTMFSSRQSLFVFGD